MHGILLVDKPEGITSNDVVRLVKTRVKPAKVGHSGTLDPAASGLMVILVGAGTRTLDYLEEHRKCYQMTIKLGEETDTGDLEGQVTATADVSGVTPDQIEAVLHSYIGVMDQIPPHYSAIKKEGVPLYKLARKGVFPDLAPRKIEIFSLVPGNWEPPFLEVEMLCSKGTYARSVARDVGRDLNVGGRLERLRRTESGHFHIKDSVNVDEIIAGGAPFIKDHLISLADALAHIPDLPAMPGEVRRLMRGLSGNAAEVSVYQRQLGSRADIQNFQNSFGKRRASHFGASGTTGCGNLSPAHKSLQYVGRRLRLATERNTNGRLIDHYCRLTPAERF